MAYVDLNPMRANMAKTPETSKHTSVRYRINAAKVAKTPKYLWPFTGDSNSLDGDGLPFTLPDYLELIDKTGRNLVKNKKGAIDRTLPTILTRLNLATTQWHELTTTFEDCFNQAAGDENELLAYQKNRKLKRARNIKTAKRLLG